jgi:NADH-quinone oxidoreductase subunit G
MPRRNPDVNKSWISNRARLEYQKLNTDRLTAGRFQTAEVPLSQAVARAGELVRGGRKVAIVASGTLTLEDNAALYALSKSLDNKAEVFGGSWSPVGKPDGIAQSGDPIGNRLGLKLLGIPDNLDELVRRAKEFDVLLVVGQDLWGSDATKAKALEVIPERIVLSAWHDATTAKATLSVGVRCWAEVRGTMINSQGRIQMMNAAPILPSPDLEPIWQVVSEMGKLGWTSELDAYQVAQVRIPALTGLNYRAIGPQGRLLEGVVA